MNKLLNLKIHTWINLKYVYIVIILILVIYHVSLKHLATNERIRINRYQELLLKCEYICISLEKRKNDFNRLADDMHREGLTLQYFKAVDGKKIHYTNYNLLPRFTQLFSQNEYKRANGTVKHDYSGHLGATLSHLTVINSIKSKNTVIFEDDAILTPNFNRKLFEALTLVQKFDPSWEVLCLGWCCDYQHDQRCHKNDNETMIDNKIVRVNWFFGGWAYCIKDVATAKKIMSFFEPSIGWTVDMTLAEKALEGALNVYGCLPTIVHHPGTMKISSWDYEQVQSMDTYRSDTNT